MVRIVSLAVVLTLIVILGITFFQVLAPFLLPLFLAGVFAILCQPLYRHFIDRCKGRYRVAAGLTTAAVLAIILVPVVTGITYASLQLFVLASDVRVLNLRDRLPQVGAGARERTEDLVHRTAEFINRQLPPDPNRTPEDVERIAQSRLRQFMTDMSGKSLGIAGRTLGSTFDLLSASLLTVFSALFGFLIFIIALYYFLADGTELLAAAEKLVPVHVQYQRELMNEFAKVVRSVVMATFFAALSQSVATVAVLWLLGFSHLMILFVLATLASLIPLMGTWLVWGPCAVWLFSTGHWIQGTFLTMYGLAFVGMLDNVVRTYVLKNDTKLHPLLAFISVLGGLQVLGLWGMFIGPIVASCLHALVKIFNHELAELSKERWAEPKPAGDSQPSHDAPSSSSVADSQPLPELSHPGTLVSATSDGHNEGSQKSRPPQRRPSKSKHSKEKRRR